LNSSCRALGTNTVLSAGRSAEQTQCAEILTFGEAALRSEPAERGDAQAFQSTECGRIEDAAIECLVPGPHLIAASVAAVVFE
jgi:hypothetical protein